nr:hypothetical protein [Tanacetum cinerariifolium]
MADSQSLKEGVKRITPESGETRPQRGSVVPFPSDNDHLTSAFVSQTGKTSRTMNIKPNEGPELDKKPYPSSLPEQTLASVGKQMVQSQEISSGKQKLSTNREGKRKSRDVKEFEQTRRVRHITIIRMIRGNTNKKRPHEQSEQGTTTRYHFLSCQDGGSSSEVMYEHCFRNLRAETKAKLKESRTPLVGFSGEVSYTIGTINLSLTIGETGKLWIILMEFAIVKSHSPYNVVLGRTGLRSLGFVASTIHSMIKFPTANGIATMTTKRETLYECRRIEEVQGLAMEGRINPRMQASKFKGTTNKEHELKTYHHIEPRVQRKRSIALDRRKVVKDEVAEWLKAGIVRKDLYPLPEIDWKIESLMRFKYKFFLDAYKGYHQIQMRNISRIGRHHLRREMGRNLKAYMDDMVIKSKIELEMIKDVEETLLTLKKSESEKKGCKNMPSPSNLKQMQRLSGKLAALNRLLSKAAEKALPCLDTLKKCTNKKDLHWMTEAEEAFQTMKKLIAELPTLTAPKME